MDVSMNVKHLKESNAAAPVKKDGRWRVIVARPGQGTSGFYSEDMLKRDAEKIIAPGGQAFINHESSRNPKDMLGIYPGGSTWSEEDKAVVSELEVFSHWRDFVDEVGPHCGVSLYALGEADEDGNVTAIVEDRLNGADLVARPGLVGSGLAEKLYESAIAAVSTKPIVTVAEDKNGDNMEIEKAIADLTTLVSSLVADKETAQATEVQAKADEAAVKTAVESYAAAVDAVDGADIYPSQRASILEAAKTGADIAPLIESAKTVKAEAAAEAAKQEAAPEGRVHGVTAYESAADLGKVLG